MEKQDFINNIFTSIDGMTNVIPNEDLITRIALKIKSKNIVSVQTIWLVAASIVVLISMNMILVKSTNNRNQSEILIFENSLDKSNQLYK